MKERLQELQETFYTEIPITYYLGVIVQDYNGSCLTLKASLEKNINQKDTEERRQCECLGDACWLGTTLAAP